MENNTNKSSERITINESKKTTTKRSSEEELLILIDNLVEFEVYTKSIKNINEILTKQNFEFFNKLTLRDNIKINLLLSKIYMNIISNDSLYNNYLISIKENETNKIELLFKLIENCVAIVEKLNTFVFSEELYNFKKKIVDFIKCIFYNCRTKIKDEAQLLKLAEFTESVPIKFFSSNFLELNKSNELYEVSRSKEVEKIANFEEKFSEINNYFEQFDAFKKFVENNSGVVNCSSVDEETINIKSEILDFKPNNDKIDFYQQYGTLLLKFCKYHNYMFLDKEEESNEEKEKIEGKTIEEKKDEKKEEEEKEDSETIRTVFLLDKIDQERFEDEEDQNKKLEKLLKNKQFVSSVDSKEYNELIKKEINYYLKTTQNIEKDEKIKKIREHLSYYLSILDIESYYPLYLKDLTKISISDNFTPGYSTNVPASQINTFYFETEENEDTLAYIEFSLEDKSKDITFELNKFENNKFANIFKEEKIQNTFKFFIFCHGYSLYEIVFDNYYSWFNSKDINFRVSLLKLSEKSKKEEENQIHFKINGKIYNFNGNELEVHKNENKDEILISIPVVLYLNTLKIISFKTNENEINDKNECELVINEHNEKDEKIIPKHLFNYLIINYIKKQKMEKDKKYKILISIFSQNRDLLSISEEIKEEFDKAEIFEKKNYIKNIGFYPEDKIDNYKIEYKLYDREEIVLTYHIFYNTIKGIKISKSVFLIDLNKLAANVTLYIKGEIITKIKGKEVNFKNINYDKIDEIIELIKMLSELFQGSEIVLIKDNNMEEENKKKVSEIAEKIKTYSQEKMIPPVKAYEYEQNEILNNAIKYINSTY